MSSTKPKPAALAQHHQIHGVQPVLPVHDVTAAAAWFCSVLGFTVDFLLDDPPTHGRVKCGSLGADGWGAPVYIHLSHTADPVLPCGETRLHVGHDIDGLHAHAVAAGALVLMPPTDQAWGLREIVLQGPQGHVLVLGAEIAAPSAA
jgi:uncharacterized glyoxalase superfamily protein PhnB